MKTLDKVKEIALAIHAAGGRAMLVGGCVRDKLLNTPVKDYDLEIYNLSAAQLFAAISNVCEVDAVGMSQTVYLGYNALLLFYELILMDYNGHCIYP